MGFEVVEAVVGFLAVGEVEGDGVDEQRGDGEFGWGGRNSTFVLVLVEFHGEVFDFVNTHFPLEQLSH